MLVAREETLLFSANTLAWKHNKTLHARTYPVVAVLPFMRIQSGGVSRTQTYWITKWRTPFGETTGVRESERERERKGERGGKQIERDRDKAQCYRTVAPCRRTVVVFGKDCRRHQRQSNTILQTACLVIFFACTYSTHRGMAKGVDTLDGRPTQWRRRRWRHHESTEPSTRTSRSTFIRYSHGDCAVTPTYTLRLVASVCERAHVYVCLWCVCVCSDTHTTTLSPSQHTMPTRCSFAYLKYFHFSQITIFHYAATLHKIR